MIDIKNIFSTDSTKNIENIVDEESEVFSIEDLINTESTDKVEINEYSKYSDEELKDLLLEKQNLQKKFYSMEQAVKLTLNSIYGAFGNEWFYFFNIDVAESIAFYFIKIERQHQSQLNMLPLKFSFIAYPIKAIVYIFFIALYFFIGSLDNTINCFIIHMSLF
jgi:hypothetical protein